MRILLILSIAILLSGCVGEGLKIGSNAPESNDEIRKAISDNKIVLLQFHADWCPQCKQQLPIVEEVAKSYPGEVELIKIDYDKDKKTVKDYFVISIPKTVLIDKDGKVAGVFVGVTGKERLEKEIERLSR